MILFTVIMMDLLAGMEFDLFVPSFPVLQSQFSLSPFLIEALLSINFIGYCLSLFVVGGLADRYGRKPVLQLGILIFIVGSIFCLWATSFPALLIGRFLQGVGIAAPVILSFLIIADRYKLKQQQFLMSILNGVMNTAAGLAPVFGSYITLYFSWQGNFTVLLLLGFLALLMICVFIPNNKPEERKDPSLSGYRGLFKTKPLVLLIVHIVLMSVPYWIFVGMAPLLYMQDLGVSLAHFGYYQGVLALVFALGSVILGFIIRSCKQKSMLVLSTLIYVISLISVIIVIYKYSYNPLLITIGFLPFIIGQIMPSNILYPVCLSLMPEVKGRIAAVIQAGRLIFCAIGLQLAGFYYQKSFQNIGIIISGFIFFGIVTLFLIIRSEAIMKVSQE